MEGAAGDPEKVTAAGPGLEASGVQAGKKTYFEVFTEGMLWMLVFYHSVVPDHDLFLL